MIELDGWQDYARMYALAALLGVVGGLAFELLQTRRRQTGLLELPHKAAKPYVDIGFFASLFVGAVAAAAAFWVFPPEVKTTVEDGVSTTVRQWDVVRVVGLSLIVGSAGGSFLSAMQARALAAVKEQQAQAATQVASAQIDAIAAKVSKPATPESIGEAVQSAKRAIYSTVDPRIVSFGRDD